MLVEVVVSTFPSPEADTVVKASFALITASPLPEVSDAFYSRGFGGA